MFLSQILFQELSPKRPLLKFPIKRLWPELLGQTFGISQTSHKVTVPKMLTFINLVSFWYLLHVHEILHIINIELVILKKSCFFNFQFFGGKIIIITKLKPNVLTEICQSNQTLSLTKVWISLNGGGCLWEKSTIKTNAGLTDQLQINITLSAKIRQIETKLVDFFMTIFGKSTTEYLVKVSLIN